MLKLLAQDPQGATLTMVLEFENLDQLLEDKPICFSSQEIGMPPGLQFIMLFATPAGKIMMANLQARNPSQTCVFYLPLEVEPLLRAGKILRSQRTLRKGRVLKIAIAASADIEALAEEIRKQGMIGPQTQVVRSGYPPEKQLETPN